jgi:hypothetical protein
MAVHPTDYNPEYMKEAQGTVCLITDRRADKYLDMAKASNKASVPSDSYSRWCGGKGGFDLYVERIHE